MMFSIPYAFASESEGYITIPALKRFAKEKRNQDLRTTVDRPQLIKDIEKYASQSEEHRNIVLDWLDEVLAEGTKDVQLKYLEDNSFFDLIKDDAYVSKILDKIIVNSSNRHLCGNKYYDEFRL